METVAYQVQKRASVVRQYGKADMRRLSRNLHKQDKGMAVPGVGFLSAEFSIDTMSFLLISLKRILRGRAVQCPFFRWVLAILAKHRTRTLDGGV